LRLLRHLRRTRVLSAECVSDRSRHARRWNANPPVALGFLQRIYGPGTDGMAVRLGRTGHRGELLPVTHWADESGTVGIGCGPERTEYVDGDHGVAATVLPSKSSDAR